MGFIKKPYRKFREAKATTELVADALKKKPAVKIAEAKELAEGIIGMKK